MGNTFRGWVYSIKRLAFATTIALSAELPPTINSQDCRQCSSVMLKPLCTCGKLFYHSKWQGSDPCCNTATRFDQYHPNVKDSLTGHEKAPHQHAFYLARYILSSSTLQLEEQATRLAAQLCTEITCKPRIVAVFIRISSWIIEIKSRNKFNKALKTNAIPR